MTLSPIAEDIPSCSEKDKVFCGNMLISGTFAGRKGGCFALSIYFFAFCLQTQAEPLHGSLTLPTLHWTATAVPNKKVPNGKHWVSLQLIRLNDNLQQHQCLQPSVAGCCMSHHKDLHCVCNRDLLCKMSATHLIILIKTRIGR